MAKKKSDVFAKKPRGRGKKATAAPETVVAAPVVETAPEPVVEVVLETPAPVVEPVVAPEPEVKKEMPRGLAVAAEAAPPQAKRKGFWELFTSFWR